MDDTCVKWPDIYDLRARDVQKIRRSLASGLDACLARHAHACTRVTAVRTVRKTGGRRCRRERKSGNGRAKRGAKRKETAAAATAATAAASAASGDEAEGGEGGARGSEQKGAPFVGGYRENEARHRVPHGPFSRHGARQRPQQSGPPSAGARCPGPVLATETTTGASLTRDSHTSVPPEPREHKPRFFHPRRYLPLSPLLAAVTAALSATSLLLVFPSFFSASPGRYRDGPPALSR